MTNFMKSRSPILMRLKSVILDWSHTPWINVPLPIVPIIESKLWIPSRTTRNNDHKGLWMAGDKRILEIRLFWRSERLAISTWFHNCRNWIEPKSFPFLTNQNIFWIPRVLSIKAAKNVMETGRKYWREAAQKYEA
jgi:hypothetical protein